jgi:uncharacterized protein YjgD (DUF1641 family)
METKTIEQQLADIHQKLDCIYSQMCVQQKNQREMTELKNDIGLIGKDMLNAAVKELEDVAPYFETRDLTLLIKKLLRNTKNLSRVLTQIESMDDLIHDIKPLTKQVFDELLNTLHEFDQKGYFEFLRESFKIFDTIITSFTPDDVRMLRENITSILLTVKSMTQPDMLNTMNNALEFFKKMDIVVDRDISYRTLFKQLKNPEVKKGLFFMLEFVKNMAYQKQELNKIIQNN